MSHWKAADVCRRLLDWAIWKFVVSYWIRVSIVKRKTFMDCMFKSCGLQACVDILSTPLRQIVCFGFGTTTPYLLDDIHRLLLTEADTDELTDRDSVLRLFSESRWIEMSPDAMKLLQQTIRFPWPRIDLEDRVRIAVHSAHDVELMKLILGPGSLPKEAFKVRNSWLLGFASHSLFSCIAHNLGHCCAQKIDDASCQAILREAVSVNGHLCCSEWDRSALVEFLDRSSIANTNAGLPEQPHRHWLQSLQRAGADLVEYGQLESRNLQNSTLCFNKYVMFELNNPRHTFRHDLMLRIINLVYGPEPEDWHIWFSWPLDGWAEDFWFLVDSSEQFDIPGAWLPEESEQ